MPQERQGTIDHIEIKVSNIGKSSTFYDGLLRWMGYRRLFKSKDLAAWHQGGTSVWLIQCEAKFLRSGYHRKRVGLNHIAFRAESKKKVDEFYKRFLVSKKVPVLYGGPKVRPEYGRGYYSVYFEDPDRIKLEFVNLS